MPAAAAADSLQVDNTNDSGTGSLRQAIIEANSSGGPPDTIAINTTGTVTLLSVLPTINGSMTITGPGQTQFIVDAGDSFQGLKIQGGTVGISGLTITHGKCDNAGCGFTGGGLFNSGGVVTLTDVAITHSTSGSQGGGIYNTGTMTLNDSLVSLNTSTENGGTNAFADGGGIWNAGTLHLVLSKVSQNTASATGATSQNAPTGGGIFNHSIGTLTLDRSTVDLNDATATADPSGTTNAVGGGIVNDGAMTLTRSTVSNNAATGIVGTSNAAMGAGIFNGGTGAVTIDRSTVSGNSITGFDIHSGGGIDLTAGSFTITSSTIAHNSALTGANLAIHSAVNLKNTIVSNPGGSGLNCSGIAATSQGFNLADDASCNLIDSTDQPSTDPMLAASLAANGGPTQTHALMTGSPAIDQGLSSAGETIDQRGENRPEDFGGIPDAIGGDGTDIGAFELQDTTPPNTIIDSGPGANTHDPTPTLTFHSTEAGSTFQCKVDGHSFVACTSPRTLAHLADGPHTFQVRARDAAGNFDPSAASRTFNLTTALVRRSGSTILVTAAPGAKDNFRITRPTSTTVRITNLPAGAFTASGIHVGPGCTRSGDYTANCSATSSMSVNVSSGTATDRILNSSPLAITFDGGAGDDALTGGPRADTLTGGPGSDVMQGKNGNDTLKGRDLTSDAAINCDGGTTPGTADKANLDLLPKDSAVSGCESVTRH
jgi:hemolysin type calcium-binding protein